MNIDFEKFVINEVDLSKVNVFLFVVCIESVEVCIGVLEVVNLIVKVVDVESYVLSCLLDVYY